MANPYSFIDFSGYDQVNRQALAGATADAVLDIIETLCTAGGQMYIAGWRKVRDADTFGLALTPPLAALNDDLRIILAGRAVDAEAPTMLLINGVTALDTDAAGVMMVALTGGAAGSYSGTLDWDAADPLGAVAAGGWFSGYIKGFTCASSSHITIWFNERTIIICIDNNSASTIRWIIAGAPINPLSQNAGDAEANDHLYAMSVVGSVATTGANGLWGGLTVNSATANRIFAHGTSDGNAHSVYRAPADGKWQPFSRDTVTGFHHKTAGNRYIPQPIRVFAPGTAAGNPVLGIMDGLFEWGITLANARLGDAMPIKIPAGGVPYTAGYFLSNGITTDLQSMFIQHIEDFQ